MPVILALPASVLAALGGALLASAVQTAIEYAEELAERRRKIKRLDIRVRVWISLAAEETDPVEKGYKTARLLNLAYERSFTK